MASDSSLGAEPTWSVLIPAGGDPALLRATLASVLAQDPGRDEMEVVVVAEEAAAAPAAAAVEEADGRVAVVWLPPLADGVARTNACLRHARGRLVHLLPGGDCVREDFYIVLGRALEHGHESVMAFSRWIDVAADGHWESLSPLRQRRAGVLCGGATAIASGAAAQLAAAVVRREAYEAVGGLDERLATGGAELELWLRLAARGPVWFEPEPLALCRTRTGLSARAIALIGEHLRADGASPAAAAARRELVRRSAARTGTLLRTRRRRAAAGEAAALIAAVRSPLELTRAAAAAARTARGARPAPSLAVPPGAVRPPTPTAYRPRIAPVGERPRPLWSVMIPTYDCAEYLEAALRSVLEQDPGPELMQIEVVDDGSSDEPEAVVRELAAGRVAFHRQPRNVGHTANFTTCIERSRGRLVHLLHGDDCVRPGFYTAMAAPFEHDHELGAAFCRYIGMDENGNWQSLSELEQREAGRLSGWIGRIAVGQRLQVVSMVVTRSAYERVGGFDRRLQRIGEDWEMWVRLASAYPVWYEPEPLALYRVHASSLTSPLLRTGADVQELRRVVAVNSELFAPDVARRIARAAAREMATTCVRRAGRALQQGDTRRMRAQLREAVRSRPTPGVLGGAALVLARAAVQRAAAARAG